MLIALATVVVARPLYRPTARTLVIGVQAPARSHAPRDAGLILMPTLSAATLHHVREPVGVAGTVVVRAKPDSAVVEVEGTSTSGVAAARLANAGASRLDAGLAGDDFSFALLTRAAVPASPMGLSRAERLGIGCSSAH